MPSRWGPFALTATALCVADRFLDGQRGALARGTVKVLPAQGITQRRHRRFVLGVIHLKPDRAHALPGGVRRAEKPGRLPVTAGIAAHRGEALEDIGDDQIRLHVGGAGERAVGVAVGLFGLACAIATRARVISAADRCEPVVEETASSARPRAAVRSPRASAVWTMG
jgi:hypothetical protein